MPILESVAGFDWDEGNRAKCQKHGVSIAEIEALFAGDVAARPDLRHSLGEFRYQVIGRTSAGRYIFLAFTLRERGGETLIRVISARYMHKKEIDHYEKEEDPGLHDR